MRIAALLAVMAASVPTAMASTPAYLGLSYICSAERWTPTAAPRQLVMVQGVGTGGFSVGGGEAQSWVNYGVKLYHAFYHTDAQAAFDHAAALAPDCSLCAWGQALAMGPTLNYGVSDADTAKALVAATRARDLARTPFERDLAAALVSRYRPELTSTERERRYGADMAVLADRYPGEPDVAALAAHALLTPTRDHDKSGIPRALMLLQRSLVRNPNDTAAIHYYIHATELAGRPAEALPYAERLASLAPEASHLVHMAAHTIFHLGRYEDVALVNAEALKVDAEYARAMEGQTSLGQEPYYAHNMMFGVAGALMAGDGDLSVKYADHAPLAFPEGSNSQRRTIVTARTLVAYGRFDPKKALKLAPPPIADPPFVSIYWRYARGEAFAASGDAGRTLDESRRIDDIAIAKGDGIPELKQVAAKVLAGRAAMLRGDPKAAAAIYAEAAAIQDKAFSDFFDPPAWWYPIHRSVAAARLKSGDYKGAEAEARRSLAGWPKDGLALRVLAEAERRLGRETAAERDQAEARLLYVGDLRSVSVDLI